MSVLCLFVQDQRSKLNLFLNTKDECSQHQALLISQQFAKQISSNTKIRGDVIILKRFRAVYILLNEVYLVAVCYTDAYPFDALRIANHAKELIFDCCKSVDVTVNELYKNYGQLLLALDELIHETNTFKTPGTPFEIISKKDKLLGTGNKGTLTARFKRERKSTIKRDRPAENVTNSTSTVNWEWQKQQIEVHDLRFQTLKKCSIKSAESIEKNDAIMDVQFRHAFSPMDSALASKQRDDRSLDGHVDTTASLNHNNHSSNITDNFDNHNGGLDTTTATTTTTTTTMTSDTNQTQPKMLDNFNLLTIDSAGTYTGTNSESESPDNSESSDLSSITSSGTPHIRTSTAITHKKHHHGGDISAIMSESEDIDQRDAVSSSLPPIPPLPSGNADQGSSAAEVLTVITNPSVSESKEQQKEPTQGTEELFDPSHILQKFKERGKILPLTITITETVNLVHKSGAQQSYQFLGQIAVKKASSENILQEETYAFSLKLKNTERLGPIVCNEKYCKQDDAEYCFKCSVPASLLRSSQSVPLLKYKLVASFTLIPLTITPSYIAESSSNTIKLSLTCTEAIPLATVSLLVTPIADQESKSLNIIAAQSKPEGRWNTAQQKILWKIESSKEHPSETKLLARFKTNNDPSGTTLGPIFAKFTTRGFIFADIDVEGCQRKKESSEEVFLGGVEKCLQTGTKYEFYF